MAGPGLFGRIAGVLGGIRGRMLLLLLVASIPVTGLAVANALSDHRAALEDGRRSLLAERAAVAARQSGQIEAVETLLRGLVRLDVPADPACAATLRQARELQPLPLADLRIFRNDGSTLCAAGNGAEAPAQALADFASSFRAVGTVPNGPPVTGTFLPASGARGALLPLGIAARQGDGSSVVVATIALRDLLPNAGSAGDAAIWLVDRAGTALPLRSALAAVPPPIASGAAFGAVEGTGVVNAADGQAYAAAALRPGLRLLVSRPAAALEGPARAVLTQRVAELATFLLLSLAAILFGADLAMVRPLRDLARRVRAWRPGAEFRPAPADTSRSEPREVEELEAAFAASAAALARREAELEGALGQRDALMAEIHHRVKNNLQIVSSLLNLQAGRIKDPAATAEFLSARNRVRALATLHRHLYVEKSFERVQLRPFLTELANNVFTSHNESPGERITLRLDVADLPISVDQAVSLALFVTEAVGNAVEHGFPEDAVGTVRLTLAQDGGDAVVTVEDDGGGLPARADRPKGLGLTLMDGFAKQLGGPLLGGPIFADGAEPPAVGTRWSVRFPLRASTPPRRMA